MSVAAAGCPDIKTDENEGGVGPTVEFDPANKIIPFPNNLLLDPATGKIKLPEQCNESPTAKALREGVLNTLDGFGTFKVTINVTFTEAVDMASLADHVFVYKAADAGTLVNPADSDPVPITFVPNQTQRFDASCANPQLVEQVTIVPLVPLDDRSTYVVGVTQGLKTATGANFEASFTWSLVRQSEPVVVLDDSGNVITNHTPLDPSDPEDLAQLQGIDLLWRVHAPALQFLAAKGHASGELLLGWSFNTQTVRDPLDETVANSPANQAATTTLPLAQVQRVNPNANGQQFMNAALGATACASLPCDKVAEVLGGGLLAKNFQTEAPNAFDPTNPIPGPWADPVTPPLQRTEVIEVLITTSTLCTTNCPTIVFGHGLGSSKTTMLAIASQLAAAGFNTVAIDFVGHDSRAVRTSDDPAIGCGAGSTAPTAPQCFAPFLSSNLAATRDSIRQSVVDVHSLVAALKACGTNNCGTAPQNLSVDVTKIGYIGISLGGIMGSLITATVPDIKQSVLNVPGVGWVDILENTENLTIRCSLVDALIDAGILTGEKFTPGTPPTGLCTTEDWKTQPGYRQFAVIGRWILDPADPANFTPLLAQKRILIQEVVGDQVVPNIATETEAALTGLMGQTADPAASATPPPSAAISNMPTTNKFVRYPTLPPDAGTGFPGNTFDHASLLRPTPGAGTAGLLGTVRLQTDAITYLLLNR
ncbi:MAG TPA: hypothetical protein VFQ53_04265 [Kofleriaceae bacterium]|nr:hypothetical protein [Kofleriaceae bacterium]